MGASLGHRCGRIIIKGHRQHLNRQGRTMTMWKSRSCLVLNHCSALLLVYLFAKYALLYACNKIRCEGAVEIEPIALTEEESRAQVRESELSCYLITAHYRNPNNYLFFCLMFDGCHTSICDPIFLDILKY